MKNITVSIDEETHRRARIRAAELGTSVSALVRAYLSTLVSRMAGEDEANRQDVEMPDERRRRLLREVLADLDAQGAGLRMSENLPREALYDREVLSGDEARALRGTGWEGNLDTLRSGR